MTNAVREEFRGRGTLVVATHAAFIDTDMAARVTQPKISPADAATRQVKALLSATPQAG